MNWPALGSMGAAILLTVAVGGIPAWAHDRPQPQQRIRGLVTHVGAGSLHVQTSNGSAAFTFNSNTHMMRIVTGSTADLAAGQTVNAQFVSGSTTIKWIRIELPHPAQKPDRGTQGTHSSTTWVPFSSRPAGRSSWQGNPPNGVEGQVVSATDTSVTIKAHVQTQTYPFTSTVAVSKMLSARAGNLITGENVQVCVNRGSMLAVSITILNW